MIFSQTTSRLIAASVILMAVAASAPAQAGEAQAAIINGYSATDAGLEPFSAERGQKLFSKQYGTGKPETPSCTSCHATDPKSNGRTRAGKDIAPMAASVTPDRYTDPQKVEKWFRRNCNSVLGRACTPQEKGDFLTFMMSQ